MYAVFDRYIRRYGYLNEFKAREYSARSLKRIQEYLRRQIGFEYVFRDTERTCFKMPPQGLRYGSISDGPFCPVGYIGDVEKHHYHKILICPLCGMPLSPASEKMPEGVYLEDIWSLRQRKSTRCTSKICIEVDNFMIRTHSIYSDGKRLGVKPKIPRKKLKEIDESSHSDRWKILSKRIIYLIALLDFQARIMISQEKVS